MPQQHETPEGRMAATLGQYGIHGFTDADGIPSIMLLHWSQNPPTDGFEDPTGGHMYLPGEILWEGVEINEGNRVHSFIAAEHGSPESFARAVTGLIRDICTQYD